MSVTVIVDDRILKDLIKNTGDEVQYIVADGVHYGIYQEFGTVHMGKQPFMGPAVEHVRPGFDIAFKNQLTNKQVDWVCKKAAFAVEAIAKALAPVRYGFLRNSIHVVKDDTHTFTTDVGGEG